MELVAWRCEVCGAEIGTPGIPAPESCARCGRVVCSAHGRRNQGEPDEEAIHEPAGRVVCTVCVPSGDSMVPTWKLRDQGALVRAFFSPDQLRRVEIFRHPSGTYGFEEARFDSVAGGWVPFGRYCHALLDTPERTEAEARGRVSWLGTLSGTPGD